MHATRASRHATVLFAICALVRAAAADVAVPLTSGGFARTCGVHIPTAGAGSARPLVLLLHGKGGSGAQAERDYRFDDVADANGVVVAYPDGLDLGHGRGWANGLGTPQDAAGVDDVAYLDALIAAISARTAIDGARVYACGISNGAMMTQRLAAQRAERYAAVASIAGPLSAPLVAAFAPSEPLSVLIIHGTDDPIVPFAGGPVLGVSAVLSAEATAELWCAADGIAGAETATQLPNRAPFDGTTTIVHQHAAGHAGSEVVLYEVQGGGHTWPGIRASNVLFVCGRVAMDWDASPTVWSFFARHAKAVAKD